MPRDQRAVWWLAAAIGLGLVLRLAGSAFGWPGAVHPDETYMPAALGMLADHTIHPVQYHNPHLFTYACGLTASAIIASARGLGVVTSARELGPFVWGHTTTFLVVSRWLSAAFGALTIVPTWWLARRLDGDRAGLAAAFVLSTNFLHGRESHFGTNDAAMVFFAVMAMTAAVRLYEQPSLAWAASSGALVGLAFGTKYNGILAAAGVCYAIITSPTSDGRPLRRWMAYGAMAIGAAIMAFFVSNPSAALRFNGFWQGFRYQASLAGAPWPGQSVAPPYQLVAVSLVESGGLVIVVSAVWGFVLAVRRHRNLSMIVALPALVSLAYFSTIHLFFVRFILLVMPCLAVFAGVAASRTSEFVASLWAARRWATGLTVVIALIFSAEPLAKLIWLDTLLARPDVRRDVGTWLIARASQSAVLVDSPTAAGWGIPADAIRATIVTPAQLRWMNPATERFKYVVLSQVSDNPPFDGYRNWCLSHAKLVYRTDPLLDRGWPELDDVYAPFHRLWSWRRPGLVTEVFEISS